MSEAKRKKKTEVKKRRIRLVPHPDPKKAGEQIKALSLNFKIIEEGQNVYELEDGSIVRIRACVTGIDRALDPKTEKPLLNKDHTPMIGIGLNVHRSMEYSEEALGTLNKGRENEPGKR